MLMKSRFFKFISGLINPLTWFDKVPPISATMPKRPTEREDLKILKEIAAERERQDAEFAALLKGCGEYGERSGKNGRF